MSQVISFRLDVDNPREAQALDTLQSLCEKGYSIRRIVTDALLNLDVSDILIGAPEQGELFEIIDQIKILLTQLDDKSIPLLKEEKQETKLSDTFLKSIQKTAKSGVRLA